MSLPSTYAIAQPMFADSRRDWRLGRRDWAFVCIGEERGATPKLMLEKLESNLASYRPNNHLFNVEPETIGKHSGRDRSKTAVPT